MSGPATAARDRAPTRLGRAAPRAAFWAPLWASLWAVPLGALLLGWPALPNGYPLVFIDTASYLWQTTVPALTWDKTWVYGPLLWLGHWHRALWGAWALQCLLLSHLLWLAGGAVLGRRSGPMHLAACAALAGLTALPWFAATLMPDALSGAVVLCAFLLGFGWGGLGRVERGWVLLVGTLSVAAHLSHLPTAAALALLVLLLRRSWRPAARAAAPALLGLALVAAVNAVGRGNPAPSPHGPVFLLARLLEDGPAAATLRAHCPDEAWVLCASVDALDTAPPIDSDWFLWAPESPLNRDASTGAERPMGGVALAAEARAIVAVTLRERPAAVAAVSLRNWWRQLWRARIGDTLGPEHLDASVGEWLGHGFPAAERRRFEAGLQARGLLPALAAPWGRAQVAVLWLSVPLLALAWWRLARLGRQRALGLVLCAMVGVSANAVTGALSKPHHRYQARIVWLLPLAAGWGLLASRRRPMELPYSGAVR